MQKLITEYERVSCTVEIEIGNQNQTLFLIEYGIII